MVRFKSANTICELMVAIAPEIKQITTKGAIKSSSSRTLTDNYRYQVLKPRVWIYLAALRQASSQKDPVITLKFDLVVRQLKYYSAKAPIQRDQPELQQLT